MQTISELTRRSNAAGTKRHAAFTKKQISLDACARIRDEIDDLYAQLAVHEKEAEEADRTMRIQDRLRAEIDAQIVAAHKATKTYENARAIFDRLWAAELVGQGHRADIMRHYNEARSRITSQVGAETILIVNNVSDIEEARRQVAELNNRLWNDYLREQWASITRPGATIDDILAL